MPSYPLHFNVIGFGDENVITVSVPGDPNSPYVADNTHPNFDALIAAAPKARLGEIPVTDVTDLFDVAASIVAKFEALSERVSANGGRIYLDGDEVHGAVTEQILRFLEEGVDDWRPLVQFFEKLQSNPQPESRDQLYTWMEAHDVTLVKDGENAGDIVFYKGVRPTDGGFESINSGTAYVNGEQKTGTIPQNIGDVVTMPRSEVAFDPHTGCSTGLHCANWRYANGWAQGAVLEVHVNPRDVVSVPYHSNSEKVRVCRYKVVRRLDAPYSTAVLPDEAQVDVTEMGRMTTLTDPIDVFDYLEAAVDADSDEVIEFTYTDLSHNTTTRLARVDEIDDDYVGVIQVEDGGYRSLRLDGIESIKVPSVE